MIDTFRETVKTLSQQELTTGLEIRDKPLIHYVFIEFFVDFLFYQWIVE
jgi:hypothetical protein